MSGELRLARKRMMRILESDRRLFWRESVLLEPGVRRDAAAEWRLTRLSRRSASGCCESPSGCRSARDAESAEPRRGIQRFSSQEELIVSLAQRARASLESGRGVALNNGPMMSFASQSRAVLFARSTRSTDEHSECNPELERRPVETRMKHHLLIMHAACCAHYLGLNSESRSVNNGEARKYPPVDLTSRLARPRRGRATGGVQRRLTKSIDRFA